MNVLSHKLCPTLSLAVVLAACGAPPDELSQTAELSTSLKIADGARIDRQFTFDRAWYDSDKRELGYEATVDGEPRRLRYTDQQDGPLLIEVEGSIASENITLIIDGEHAEYWFGDSLAGEFAWQTESLTTDLPSDPLSFALLSIFPHQHAGLNPDLLFASEAPLSSTQGSNTRQQGLALLKKLFPRLGGGASANCEVVTTVTCTAFCPTSAGGCDGCGGACGIACCSACETSKKRTYGVSVEVS